VKKLSGIVAVLYIVTSCSPSKTNPEVTDTTVAEQASGIQVNDSLAADSANAAWVGENPDIYLDIKSYIVGEEAIPPDSIQLIDFTCAIFIWPTAEQMARSEGNEDEFNTAADDFGYYMSKASKHIDTLQVKITDATERYLKLKGRNGTRLLDIRKEGMPRWNIIFFNITKDPRVESFWEIAVDEERSAIRQYFDLN
jgi:hypothetical protein